MGVSSRACSLCACAVLSLAVLFSCVTAATTGVAGASAFSVTVVSGVNCSAGALLDWSVPSCVCA